MTLLRRFSTVFLLLILPDSFLPAQAGKKQLTVDMLGHTGQIVPAAPRKMVWRPRTDQFSFIGRGINGSGDSIWLYDAVTGWKHVLINPSGTGRRAGKFKIDAKQNPGRQRAKGLRLSSYRWSPDGNQILLRGAEGDLWLLDVKTNTLRRLTHHSGPMENLAFSPHGNQIGFVRNNNIYVLNVKTGHARQLTTDGSPTLLDGTLDWVYGEELAYRATGRSYQWSPDGTKIAYLQLDDGPVPQYPIVRYRATHATVFDQRYPQPGDANPVASMHIVNVNGSGPGAAYKLSRDAEYIVPSFTWTPDSKSVCFLTLNRHQTREVIHLWNGSTDRRPVVETDPYWINNVEPPQFVDGGDEFLWLSERDGWNHLYLYTRAGKLVRKLTRGDWLIDHPIFQNVPSYQVAQAGGWIYFESTDPDPRERQIYRVRLDGKGFQRLTAARGTHTLTLSPDGRYILDRFSSVTQPPEIRLLKSDGTPLATIDQRANHLAEYALGKTEFVTLKAADGSPLYARLVKPPDFDPAKKYPVIVDIYGGPGIQIVRDQWGVTSWMDQLFSERGFLIWSLDNHGSAGRGHQWETVIYEDMGKHELADQLIGVKYLKSLPYADPSRLGIFGWSYGGYMTLYTLTHAPDTFKCGIAGAPVTDWHYYDSIYTERYMRTPDENPAGYRDSSDVLAADHLKARLLLIHGLADDNVHPQNTVNFIRALIKARKPYDLYVQPAQKHGFSGGSAIWYMHERIFEFFMHNL